ncbi:MAG: G1 family glutamic endopeptidase [Thermomicrobiales bacterium]
MRRIVALAGSCTILLSLFYGTHAGAASSFAAPAFQQQWQQGEAITTNFWGPLATAHDGRQESYKDAPSGQRLVQYFDKGRMELSGAAVTNGLLATEMVTGRVQVGDNAFENRPPPALPIAGDPDNPGPTYAALNGKAKALFDAAPARTGSTTQSVVFATGDISVGTTIADSAAIVAAYDAATKHNVPKAFAEYRTRAGLQTIGYAIAEPFFATVKIGGVQRQVMVQVFERRVLTYTATNPPTFQVEMGNVGSHYYQWRYGSSGAPAPDVSPSPAVITATPTLNWSGYGVDAKAITTVHAAWIVPAAVAPPTTGYAATWVGIGGQNTEDLIQAGTVQDIEDGVPTYYAWVEVLPDALLGVSPRRFPARPGDVFAVTIANTGGNNWSIMLENRTTGQHLSLTVTYASCTCSAEWVEEVPEIDGVNDPALANFGTVAFTEATATVGGVLRAAADLHPEPLALKQGGKVVAQPSMSADGASLTVAYVP